MGFPFPDDIDDDDSPLCPVCGAYSPRQCEMLEETGGECPWELMQEDPTPSPAQGSGR